MRVFGLLLLGLSLSLPLLAETKLTTQIYDIDYGQKDGEETLVFLTSGHVAKINLEEKSLAGLVTEAKSKDSWYQVTMDDDRYITSLEVSSNPGGTFDKEYFRSLGEEKNTFVPTTIADMGTAQKYFREGRHSPKDSQCFNRALIWTYEWWKNHSLRSMKLLIYFTRNYIRRYNFEWWFHIAPYVHVMENGKVVERVMDVKYTRGPIEFRKWTNIFMKNDAECNVITKYSDYADHPYSGECYLQRTNMYTYQPADLQMNEAWGYTKSNFIYEELKGAYLEAFDINF